MIDPSKVGIGDFVIAPSGVSDYIWPGDIFRLIDSRVPGEPTSAVGWKLNPVTGIIDSSQAYKFPHSSVELAPRHKVAEILKTSLKKIKLKVDSAKKEYNVLESRINGLLSHFSREEEVSHFMSDTFGFIK